MNGNDRRENKHRALTFSTCALAVGICHAYFADLSAGLSPGRTLEALPFLDIVRVRDFGSALAELTTGTSAIQAAAGVLGIVISTVVAWTLSRLSDARYRWQFLLVHLAIASGWLLAVERVVLGYHVDYFSVHFDRMYWPAFSVPSFLLASIFALLMPYALIRFFRRDTAPAGSSQSAGRLLDPYYQARAPLRVLIVLTAFAISLRAALAAATLYSNIAHPPDVPATQTIGSSSVSILVPQQVATTDVLVAAGLAAGILIAGGLVIFLGARFFWRLIPGRPIDVAYFRAFQNDPAATRTLTRVRKALGQGVRVTGVKDPKESRRFIYLLLWLYFPIFFALGDFSKANALRHNVFLVGNWQDGIMETLAVVRAAIFDCGAITGNLAWELSHTLNALGSLAVIVIYPKDTSTVNVTQAFVSHGVDPGELSRIPPDRWVSQERLDDLVGSIRASLAPVGAGLMASTSE